MNLKDRRIQLPRCPDCGQRVYYRTDGTKTEAGSWEEHECPGQPTDDGGESGG